jgi:hypothetical protein
MISIQKRFLFVHVPKTGGNSIQNILSTYSEDAIVSVSEHQDGLERFELRNSRYETSKHSKLSKYKRVLDASLYNSLFKFATIRNPWDRMISLYFSPHRGVTEWNRAEFLELVNKVPTLRRYVCEKSLTQSLLGKFGLPNGKGRRALDADVDVLMRFEHLEEDFRKVCARLEIPFSPLPKRNASIREHYSKYYDEELKLLVQEKFREEIEFGDYRFDDV